MAQEEQKIRFENTEVNKVVYRMGSCDIMLPKYVIEWLISEDFPLYSYIFNTQENGSNYNIYDVPRHHPLLLKCVEKFHDILYKHPYNLRVETIKGNKYYVDKEETGEKVITPNDIEWVIINNEVSQNPAWSEDDERMYRGLHNLIYSTPYCDSRKELSDWLQSLKDRVQLKDV